MERFVKPDTYAVWSNNENTRYMSTSGGAFTEFSKYIIANGGSVAGARYNPECLVEHALVNDMNGIEQLRQSKYMQSDLKDIFKQIKDKLNAGKLVGFSGAPCQVAGLYAYLGNDYDNLFTMDFICRGMNSPKAFKAWLNEEENKVGKKAVKVWFKYKEGGWKSSPMRTRIDFSGGIHEIYEGDKNLFMYGYLNSNLYIKPSCGDCRFKGVPRQSDVTFADFWGIDPKFDDDKGTSMLLVNSEKGRNMFSKIQNEMQVHKMDFESIFAGNPMFSTSVIVPENASVFLEDLDNMSFTDALKKNGGYPYPVPLWRKILRKMKRLLKNGS